MKNTLLALGLAAAMMPFAFAGQQAPATSSGTNSSTAPTKKVKKTKKTKKSTGTTTSATPSK
jgi:hypothetical protein